MSQSARPDSATRSTPEVPLRRKFVPVYKTAVKALAGHGIGRLPVVRQLHTLVRSRLKSTYAEVEGHKMYVDALDSLNISLDEPYSPLQTWVVRQHVKPGDTVVDIGANIGFYTLIFAQIVGESGRVVAFEPDPENFDLLRRNVALNGYRNVTLVPKAVSRANEETRLYLSDVNTAGHRIYDSRQNWRSVPITAVRLDDYFGAEMPNVDFLKMDIEGSELAAFEGMATLIAKSSRLTIMTEFYPFGLTRFGYSPRTYLDSLSAAGFAIYDIDGRGGVVEPATVDDLVSRYDSSDEHSHTNLLCLRAASSPT